MNSDLNPDDSPEIVPDPANTQEKTGDLASIKRLLTIIAVLLGISLGLQVAILSRQQPGSPVPSADALPPAPAEDAAVGSKIDLAGMPIKGESTARVVLVEFSDYECPFCTRHATNVLGVLEQQYIATGKVRYAFANLPLPSHPEAKLLAGGAICAGVQNKYWPMHDQIFATQPRTKKGLVDIAQRLGLDAAGFSDCLEADSSTQQIDADLRQAEAFNLTGTPSFALGTEDSTGQVTIVKIVVGAQPLGVFQQTLDAILKTTGD